MNFLRFILITIFLISCKEATVELALKEIPKKEIPPSVLQAIPRISEDKNLYPFLTAEIYESNPYLL